LAQVQVSRVLGVKSGHKFHEWNNRINRLSYDFVVCAKDASVLAAIAGRQVAPDINACRYGSEKGEGLSRCPRTATPVARQNLTGSRHDSSCIQDVAFSCIGALEQAGANRTRAALAAQWRDAA